MIIIFQIIALLFSAIIHEYSHGWMADYLGDPTAKNAGRLTLNPLAHLEWFGSFFLPLIMIISGLPFVFGWAKPVPYNPFLLKDRRYGEAKVAIAGPLANIILAILFAIFLRLFPVSAAFAALLEIAIYINLILAIFNLIPIPPLDGSKVLAVFLSPAARSRLWSLEKYGFILVVIFLMFGSGLITPVVSYLFKMLVGA